MNVRMVKFLNKNKTIFEHQYGFQEKKSTSLAILDLQSQLTNNIENKIFSCSIFLDFSKAFDTVNHSIFAKKTIILWFQRNRIFLVLIIFI